MIQQRSSKADQLRSDDAQERKPVFAPGRYAMLIDGSSIYYALRGLSADIDYRKLHELFGNERLLVRATYHALTLPNEEAGSRPLLDWLAYNGYTVREKFGRAFHSPNGRPGVRGRLSIEMAVEALELATLIDHLVLFSGDADLAAMVEAVQRKGVHVTAVSTLATRPPVIAAELRRQVDRFIDLRDLMPFVGRERQLTQN